MKLYAYRIREHSAIHSKGFERRYLDAIPMQYYRKELIRTALGKNTVQSAEREYLKSCMINASQIPTSWNDYEEIKKNLRKQFVIDFRINKSILNFRDRLFFSVYYFFPFSLKVLVYAISVH